MGPKEQEPRDGERTGFVERSHGFSVRSLDVEARTISVVASSESLDSHDEVVEQKWRFARYEKNPVILWAHNKAAGHDGLPIGRGKNWRVENDDTGKPVMKMDIVFASADANPFADSVFKLFQEDILKSVSVGFRPHAVRMEKRKGSDEEVYVLSDNELYELSVVPVGSNPDAIVLAGNEQLLRMKEAARAGAHKETNPANHADEETHNMDAEKELKDLRVSLDESREAAKAASTKAAELETKVGQLSLERDALMARANTAETKLIATEVEALVGKKIHPVSRDKFVKLRTTLGEKEFNELVADLPALPTLTQVIGEEQSQTNKAAKGGNGVPTKIAARLEKVGS